MTSRNNYEDVLQKEIMELERTVTTLDNTVDDGTELAEPLPAPDVALLDSILVVVKHRWLIAKVTLACAFISVSVSLLLPIKYTGVAKILPPKDNQSITNLIVGSQLGALASLASQGGALSMKDPNDMYVAMLKSRTVIDAIIRQFGLDKVYKTKTMLDTVKRLQNVSDITAGQDSIITIEVEDRDANRAADIANAYVNEFSKLTITVLNRDATQRRMYLGGQLEKAKQELAGAEADLRSTQERTGMIALGDQARAIIESVARLRAKITATQVELQGMRTFATPQNPDVIRLQTELKAMRGELTHAQENEPLGGGNIQVPTGKVPAVGMEYARKLREVKYSEMLLELIAKQYELARLDEANSVSAVQVLDKASPPDKKSSPKRGLIVMLSTLCAFFVSIALAFTREYVSKLAAHPEGAVRLQQLEFTVLSPRRNRRR